MFHNDRIFRESLAFAQRLMYSWLLILYLADFNINLKNKTDEKYFEGKYSSI